MSIENINVAVLVHSCDRYEFLYEGFHYFFSRNWDYNIHCNYYFATEEKDIAFPGFINIKSGKGEWSNRLSILLKEKIKEDYILYFQEDMWLNKKINANFFNQLFAISLKKKWKQVKLHSSDVYKTIATPYYIEGFNVTKLDNLASNFLLSHQVTLWERDFLLAQLLDNETPWLNEMRGTKRLRQASSEIIHLDYFAENGGLEINKNKQPIDRSEYQTISYNATLHHNIRPFIKQLMKGSDEQKEYATKLKCHYLLQLTHDGKAKPQKESISGRFKIWLKGLRPRIEYALFGILE